MVDTVDAAPDGHRHPPRSLARGLLIFAARLAAAIIGAVVFGWTAAGALPPWSVQSLLLLGFGFGFFFVGGTGYRILIAVARSAEGPAPASWSGAAAGAALYALALTLLFWPGGGAPYMLSGFGLAINVAYGLVKTSCALVGCCMVDRRRHPWWPAGLDLRLLEIGVSLLALAAAGTLVASGQLRLAAVVGIGGHMLMRLTSRWLRGRLSSGWPPLRQPGAELFPLYMLVLAALVAAVTG